MAKRLQYRRVLMLALLLAAAFAGLGYRLVDLQVVRHDALSAEAQKRRQRELLLEPRRGDILDVKGNLLATSVFVKTVCADPTLIGNRYGEVAHAIAPLLQMSENELLQRLVPRLRQNEKGETVEIYRKGKPSAVLASARPAGKKNWKPAVPIKIEGFSLSKAILEEREESAS